MQHLPTSTTLDKSTTSAHVAGYVIERQIARGGMATVYLALQESLQRYVALKIIAPSLKGDPDFTKRFLREGRLVAKLTDPRIITVFDIGADGDVYYLAMEYLPGGTLRDRIQAGLSLDDTLQIVRTVAGALGYAHKRGIVHRDIKPQNIMFHENGDPVLTDFGIAKAIGGNTVMTGSGVSFGTPRYMSPEQIKGQTVDGRSDLYSLGVLFYEMLTGQLPYRSDDSFALAFKHVTEPIPNLPSDLGFFQPLLNRLLAKNPDQRFPNAEQLLNALREFESQHLLTPTVTETSILPTQQAVKKESVPKPSRHYWLIAAFVALIPLSIFLTIYFFASPNTWIRQFAENIGQGKTDSGKKFTTIPVQLPDASVFLTQAQRLQSSGALEEGLKTLAEGLKAYPENSALLALRERIRNQLEQQQNQAYQKSREAKRLLERAQRYRKQENFEAALMDIEEGLKMVSQHPDLLNLRVEILKQQQETQRRQSQEKRQQKVDRLLSQAQQSKAKGNLASAENYIAEGLRLMPNHSELSVLAAEIEQDKIAAREEAKRHAETERRQQMRQFLDQARQLQQQQQFEASLKKIDEGLEIFPDYTTLLALRQKVSMQLETQPQIAALLEECKAHFEANRLTTGVGGNALNCYNNVLSIDPGNSQALAGLESVAEKYANWADKALQDGTLQNAETYLQRLAQVNPEFPRLTQLQRRLAALQSKLTAPPASVGNLPQNDSTTPQPPVIGEMEADAFWTAIRDSNDIDDFEQFLRLFGDHPRYGLAARLKRERLRREQAQVPALERASLTVEANVPDAQVWIDGKNYGSTGRKIDMTPGTYRVSVAKEGYQEWSEQIRLVTGHDENLRAMLSPLSPSETPPPLESPTTAQTLPKPQPPQETDSPFVAFGCLEGNCTSGSGTYLFKNGDKYSGSWRNSKIHNRGTYYYKNGEKYEGEFKNGTIHGTGTYFYNSGNRYEGQWQNGIKSGTGTHYYATRKEKYVGEFKDNKPNGHGTYYYQSGDRYEGGWQNGRKHGEGKFYRSNGESYAGVWENNRRIKVIFLKE